MLVPIEADPVPGAMDEELAIARVVDDAPCRRVDRFRRCILARGRIAGLLRSPHGVMDLLMFGARVPANVDGAGDVGAIAAHGPAEVEDDGVALGDAAVADLVVRRRSVRTRSDDRESDLVVTFRAE